MLRVLAWKIAMGTMNRCHLVIDGAHGICPSQDPQNENVECGTRLSKYIFKLIARALQLSKFELGVHVLMQIFICAYIRMIIYIYIYIMLY